MWRVVREPPEATNVVDLMEVLGEAVRSSEPAAAA